MTEIKIVTNLDGNGSLTRPPPLNSERFQQWKQKMEDFLILQDPYLWQSILLGPHSPTTPSLVAGEAGVLVPKRPEAYTDEDRKKITLDHKAKTLLRQALPPHIYDVVMNCKSTQEVWKEIELIHEGSDDVKLNKLNRLTQQYELFMFKQGENLKQTYERFLSLINELRSYGKEYPVVEICDKFTRVIPVSWKLYCTMVKQDLKNEITLSKLYGRLLNYQLGVEQQTSVQTGSNPSAILETSLLQHHGTHNAFSAEIGSPRA